MTPDPAQVDVACSVDGCPKPVKARGWCSTHHYRWQKYGDVHHVQPQFPPAPERLWAQVEKTSTCWLWTGYIPYHGYGVMQVDGRQWRVHRYAWTLLRGPIPDGLVLDHLCRVHNCVNPDHLEPVTVRANTRRGIGPSAINARKTHCKNGHKFGPETTLISPKGERLCRPCRNALARKYKAAKRRRAA